MGTVVKIDRIEIPEEVILGIRGNIAVESGDTERGPSVGSRFPQ
jgi:hypothetical protein